MTTTTHVESLDRSVHATNLWLKEVSDATGLPDRHQAYKLLRATLHAVRDRLPPEEAVQLAAQLPALVRGFYYDGWSPTGKPERIRSREEFLDRVRARLDRDEYANLEEHARSVLAVLSQKVSTGEIEDVQGALPKELSALWSE